MQTITIGTKNQIVIPKEVRQKIPNLKPGQRVSVYALDKQTLAIKISDKNWVEKNYGIMKEELKNKDLEVELEKMRAEWDEK